MRKERTKRRVLKDLHRARDPEVAQAVIEEIKEEIEQKVAEKKEGRVPGRIVAGSKTIYTYRDLCDMFPIVSFTPMETVPLSYQGVKVIAYAGIEMHVPQCFKEIYEQYSLNKTKILKSENLGGLQVWPGAGSLE